MGIIKAFVGAISGGLADQWEEVIEAGDMSDTTVFVKGVKVRANDKRNERRSSNKKGTSDLISNGSIIQVKENQNVLTDYVETKTKLHAKLVSEFKEESKTWDMSIGKDLSMRFNNPTVLFAQGSAAITPQFKVILDEFIPKYLDSLLNDSLRSHIQEIRIEGHTDNVPISSRSRFESNDVLSMYRALSVADYIRSNTNLDPSHIKSSGRGDYDPVADNATADGRARNRRVEIKVYNSYKSDLNN